MTSWWGQKPWFLRVHQPGTTALHRWLWLSVTSRFHCNTVINSAGQQLHISFSQLKSHVVLTWLVCAGQQADLHTAAQRCRTWCTVSLGFKQDLASHVGHLSFTNMQSVIVCKRCVNKLYFYSALTWRLLPWMENCLFNLFREFYPNRKTDMNEPVGFLEKCAWSSPLTSLQ